MVKRAYNFNPGPAALPLPVLEKVKEELLDYHGTGMSILEISHRSKEFENVINDANELMRKIYNIPDEYKVLWLQGGSSTQFYMVPANLMLEGKPAEYVNTGSWSKKAIKEAKFYGDVNVVASSEDKNFSYIPSNVSFNDNISYAHITSNNTIYGTQWQNYPAIGDAPLVSDMCSDFLSRPVDIKKFGVLYASAQKNLGPAGVTAVLIREDLINRGKALPTMISYKTHAEKNSLFNTPPCFSIYVCKLVLEWIKSIGGLNEIEKRNKKKSSIVYGLIDKSNGFYKGHAEPNSRSNMNVTFRLPSEELEAECINQAKGKCFVGIKGHRSVGGMRISLYNAVPVEAAEEVAEFLKEFQEAHTQ
ncbi:MAG: phosphoserine transaminase [Thermoplasmatales archaeon]|nr:phosphoserine transaminase [Thermoplasmatales archaeon]